MAAFVLPGGAFGPPATPSALLSNGNRERIIEQASYPEMAHGLYEHFERLERLGVRLGRIDGQSRRRVAIPECFGDSNEVFGFFARIAESAVLRHPRAEARSLRRRRLPRSFVFHEGSLRHACASFPSGGHRRERARRHAS